MPLRMAFSKVNSDTLSQACAHLEIVEHGYMESNDGTDEATRFKTLVAKSFRNSDVPNQGQPAI